MYNLKEKKSRSLVRNVSLSYFIQLHIIWWYCWYLWQEIPFEYSLHAKRFASHIIQTYGKILDWSSISPNNFVYRTLTTNYDQTDDGDADALAIKTELEFLSQKTRNMPFRVKNEGGDLPLKHCLASSPK